MAEATAETIPCEHCNTQVNLHDWPWHSRQCVPSERKEMKTTEKDTMDESTTDGIPCEFCGVQISLDDWQSHIRQCADAHRNRVEKLKNGGDEESVIEFIPCEYCNAQINVHEWEWHSQQCANNNKHATTNIDSNINEPTDAVIPCEYCAALVNIDDWTSHTKQCAEAEKQRTIFRRNEELDVNLIPCEYCDKVFSLKYIEDHQNECRRKQTELAYESNASNGQIFGGIFPTPKNWNQSSPYNLSRYILDADTEEYKFVADNFHKTLPSNEIVQIERIQNRRWYRQYEAHKDDFIERYGKSTEQWLFHGCKSESTEAIINDCFNRSHSVRCAAGQGIYFATQASTSLSYTQPDANNLRHMFMARVLVGKTTKGSQSTRVCPPGFDTTGGGTVFVTYHDAQAYGEYLITFK